MNPNFGPKSQTDDYNGYIPDGKDSFDYTENRPLGGITIDNLNPSYYEKPTGQLPNLDTYSNSNDESAPGAHAESIARDLAREKMREQTAAPEEPHDTAAIDVTQLTRDELARSIGNSREIAYNNAKEELEALKKDNELLLKDLEGTKAELSAAIDKAAKNLERINWLESYSKKLSKEQDELSPTFGLERPDTTTSETKVLENNSRSVTRTLENNSREGFNNLGPIIYTDREGGYTNPGMERRSKYEEGLPEEYSSFSGPEGESNNTNTSPEDYSEGIA